MWFTYILFSNRLKRYYIGSTSNIERRLGEHNSGKSTYTRKGVPWTLIYSEKFESRQDAYRREMEIKKYKGGIQFKALINNGGVA